MAEILLIRHAQAKVNEERKGDGTDQAAVGNISSPLTKKGIGQVLELEDRLRKGYGVEPDKYDEPIAVSQYQRAQETAKRAGFCQMDILKILNEIEITDEIIPLIGGRKIIEKHATERWMPGEVRDRSGQFIDAVQSGELDYGIYFSHGMFIASVLLECESRGIEFETPFDEKRGFVPLQTGIVKLEL